MPDIDEQPASQLIKAIYMGDSGSGKTGSLMSLAAAGYNVRVLDVDKGVDILRDYAINPTSPYKQARPGFWTTDDVAGVAKRIKYATISETFTNTAGQVVPKGDSWNKILAQLTEWKDGEIVLPDGTKQARTLGRLESWGPGDVLAVDSFSRVCDARMYQELVINARAVSGRQQQDYWKVQDSLERFLELLVSPNIPCHVLLLCHIEYVEKDDKTTRGMPQSMGKALGPKIGQHFNHALLARSQGQGTGATRKIITNTTGVIDLKNAAPLRVKPEYALETGLLEYFQAILGTDVVRAQTKPKAAA